jgi:hypothetical protein
MNLERFYDSDSDGILENLRCGCDKDAMRRRRAKVGTALIRRIDFCRVEMKH